MPSTLSITTTTTLLLLLVCSNHAMNLRGRILPIAGPVVGSALPAPVAVPAVVGSAVPAVVGSAVPAPIPPIAGYQPSSIVSAPVVGSPAFIGGTVPLPVDALGISLSFSGSQSNTPPPASGAAKGSAAGKKPKKK